MVPVRALVVAPACTLGMVTLGLAFAGERSATGPDAAFASWAESLPRPLLSALVLPTEPPLILGAIAIVAFCLGTRRRWSGVALIFAAPALAVTLNGLVLKPLFGRYYTDHLAYPSGHTVSLAAAVVVLVLLARRHAAKAGAAAAGVLLVTAAGIGMAGLGYHYATDVLGGALWAVAVTTAIAWGLARYGRRGGGVPRQRREPADRT
ncbi:phosphatase PAP2 family protein [Saccharomonospora sp. NPDC006951]